MAAKPPAVGDNPFAHVMGTAQKSAEDFHKLFADMKLPAMPNMEALMAAQKRNLEALTAANRIALEGAQAVAKRHMEIVQQTMSELTETVQSLSSAEPPQQK